MRISGVEIPDNERAQVGLTRFFGIGPKNVIDLAKKAGINLNTRIKDLSRDDIGLLMKALETFKVEGDLKKEVRENIDRLKAIRCYRGIRHIVLKRKLLPNLLPKPNFLSNQLSTILWLPSLILKVIP